jgi:hypothetical protein
MRDAAMTTISLQEGIMIAIALERPEVAALLTGAFEGLCERYGVRPPTPVRRFLYPQDPVAAAQAALDDENLQAAVARGRRMSLNETMALIVELGDSVEAETS